MAIHVNDLYAARRNITGVACRTPLVPAWSLSGDQRDIRLKLETTQPMGAFKLRGAANALARLSPDQARNGVACVSTGNHGRAVAYAARRLGIPAYICMSRLVPENKVAAIKAVGGQVQIAGDSQDEAQHEVNRLVTEQGMTEIPPFDHFDVVAGQGTIGIELVEDFPELDTVIVPLSGGGLIAGVALAVKTLVPGVRVIGLSMEKGAAMYESIREGRPVEVSEQASLADSLGGGIGLENRYTFAMVRDLVDEIRIVPETQIAGAMRALYRQEGWVAEGAGAIGLVPLLHDLDVNVGRNIAIVVSGKNIDMDLFARVMDGEVPY
ncbi:MAG: hydroxyectoine utilization dehydratase EutB [Gammaproteobacteria bacterium]|nr:hydroxyectoine utilization dehydratase EutB [Gammaproteobacteria bacterium]